MVSTESDEYPPREEQYSGGGTHRVYDLVFAYTQQAAAMAMIAIMRKTIVIFTINRHHRWQ